MPSESPRHIAHRIGTNRYSYRGYTIRNHGYFPPDKCIWWEAYDGEGNVAEHAHTLRAIKRQIDEFEDNHSNP